MSFIRGAAIIILSTIIFLAFFAGNIFLTLSWSMEHDTLQSEVQNISSELIEQYNLLETINENKGILELYCQATNYFSINEMGIQLNIPCNILLADTQTLVNYTVTQVFDQIYYKDYPCQIWDCIKQEEQPLVLISEKAQNYWKSKFLLTFFISLACFILFLIITKDKSVPLLVTGILSMIAALPFKKLDLILKIIPDSTIANIVGIFLTKAPNVFWTFFLIGIGLIIIGIAFKFLKIGLRISRLFTRKESAPEPTKEEIQREVKKEIKKKKEKTNKPKKDLTEKEMEEEKKMPSKKELEEVLKKKKK